MIVRGQPKLRTLYDMFGISVGTVPPIAAPAVGVAGTDHAEQAAPSGPDENSST